MGRGPSIFAKYLENSLMANSFSHIYSVGKAWSLKKHIKTEKW